MKMTALQRPLQRKGDWSIRRSFLTQSRKLGAYGLTFMCLVIRI